MNGHKHWTALDGLRGWAILLVFLYHGRIINTDGWLGRVWTKVFGAGWAGVDLFFVLSGFLITGILMETRNRPGYFRNFFMRRTLRIFPVYYLLLGVLLATATLEVADGKFLWHAFYLMNFYYAGNGLPDGDPLAVSWSLAVEEQFYLLWPFAVLLVDNRRLKYLCLGVALTALSVRCAAWSLGYPPIMLYVLPFCRMDALAVGGLLAVYHGEGALQAMVSRFRREIAGAGLVSAAILAVTVSPSSPAMATVGYTANAIFFAGVLAWLITGGLPKGLLRLVDNGPMRLMGKYSYGMYLYHKFVLLIGGRWYAEWLGRDSFAMADQMAYLVLTGGALLLVSAASYHLYEEPFLRLKRYFPRHGEPEVFQKAA